MEVGELKREEKLRTRRVWSMIVLGMSWMDMDGVEPAVVDDTRSRPTPRLREFGTFFILLIADC